MAHDFSQQDTQLRSQVVVVVVEQQQQQQQL